MFRKGEVQSPAQTGLCRAGSLRGPGHRDRHRPGRLGSDRDDDPVSIHTDRLNEVLDSWIERHDIGDYPVTVRHYLVLLLRQLWIEDEGFSGKRPFGNSGWKYDIYTSLVLNGFIPGRVGDDDEGLIEFDRKQADDLIRQCIYHLSRKPE